jgi:hypothetical protein
MTRKSIDWEGIIAKGENPKGFTAQTPNGTAHWQGTGWNDNFDWQREQVAPDKTRPAGRSNRTGE